jgi:serine/threonine-protein kinase
LREAHAQGVIHRDLKPGNVLITRSDDGEEIAKVLDFGLAKRMSVGGDDTNPNLVPGSPKYMPPEAIRQGQVDGRADIYSLGVMLYQMLTGVVPFDRPNPMDILVAHLQEAPRPMSTANPRVKIPQPVERLVMRCLAKQPEQRYASMQAVLEAIRGVTQELGFRSDPTWTGQLSMHPGAAPPSMRHSPLPRLRLKQGDVTPPSIRPPRRWSGTGVFMLMTAVTLVLGGAIYLWLDSERSSTATGEPVASSAEPAESPPAAPEPDESSDIPDMVISESELAEPQPTPVLEPEAPVSVAVRSEPPGARVILRGKVLGETPMTFSHLPGTPRRPLMMRLEKEGYETFYVRRDVTGAELVIDEDLIPSPTKAEPSPAVQPPPKAADEAGEPQAPDTVIKITPSDNAEERGAGSQDPGQ